MREKELRLSLICYGGISLAVYMHGITREIWKLLRASRRLNEAEPAPGTDSESVYYDLLSEVHRTTRLRVMVDIIAGASAGGINGIFLAHAISTGGDLDALTDLWLERADIDELLDPAAKPGSRWSKFYASPFLWYLKRGRGEDLTGEVVEAGARAELEEKLSRFIRSRWFQPPFSGPIFTGFLLDAFDAINAAPAGDPLLPPGQPLDLFVTVTDFAGHPETLRLNSPPRIEETEHRKIISFRDEGARGEARFLGDAASLTFAARATASFPGAFPPFQARELETVLERRGRNWPERDKFLARVFPNRTAAGEIRRDVSLLDGSILNNAPFQPAIAALRNRPAHREIDRRFVYIDPKPGIRSIGGRPVDDEKPPGFFTTIIRSLSDIPREQPIRDDLEALQGMSRRVRRMRHVLAGIRASTETAIEESIGPRVLKGKPTPKRLKVLRDRANADAVARAGFAYPGYAHLKMAQIVDEMAAMLAALGGYREMNERDDARRAIWTWIRREEIDEVTRTVKPKLADQDRFVGFLRRFDLGFRIRRLRFIIRRARDHIEEGGGGDAAKEVLFSLLAPYLDRRNESYYGPFVRDPARHLTKNPGSAIESYGDALGLSAFDTLTDMRFSELLRREEISTDLRRTLLAAYLGFPFYDIATFPMLQGEGLDEYNEIKIDRISPDDATSIREGGATATLKGLRFNSFGAFFSRAYRENDYLWGRLHGAERLIDIVLSSVAGHGIDAEARRKLKSRIFHAILDAEQDRLTSVPDLVDSIHAEIDN